MLRLPTITLVASILWLGSIGAPISVRPANGQATAPKVSADQAKQVDELFDAFKAADNEADRKAAFEKILSMGKAAVQKIGPAIDKALESETDAYFKRLEPLIRSTYILRLESLTDEQIAHVVRTRLLWQPYVLNGGAHKGFRETHLAPIWEMKGFLLPTISDIDDEQVKAMRERLVEYAGYQVQCHRVLGISPDPTVGKKSPTGIEYAPLDQPPTYLDTLSHHERTLILIHTVASAGARKVLLMTDEAAREIDVQEAEFVMAANEVRMLAGSIAWRADALGCAVARDHSNDRKDGKAKGHMSDVPGKRGFTHRNKRMGAAFFGSEGVGGGRDGRSYLNSLSYSGEGHGGPLYRLRRNRVGVGRRGGAFTSQYGTDKQYVHPCPATEDELWMPPGLTPRDLRDSSLRRAYLSMKSDSFGSAIRSLDQAKSLKAADAIAARFFRAAIDEELDRAVNEIKAAEQSGDVFYAKHLLDTGEDDFKGLAKFEEQLADVSQRLNDDELRADMHAGKAYYRLYAAVKDLPQDKFDANRRGLIQRLEGITRKYENSIYGKAAADAINRLADPKSNASALQAYFKERG